MSGFYSSDYRRILAADIRFNYRKIDQENRNTYGIYFLPRIRISNKLSFFMDFGFDRLNNDQGFVNRNNVSADIGLAPNDILMGRRKLDIYENSIRGQYIFTNRQSLSVRVRHYNANVKYNSVGVLNEEGEINNIGFDGRDDDGDPIFDQNFNAFTVDMNYLWRFAPGSDVIINFKSDIRGNNDGLNDSYFENISRSFDLFQENSLSLRVVYFLDYLYLK